MYIIFVWIYVVYKQNSQIMLQYSSTQGNFFLQSKILNTNPTIFLNGFLKYQL